MNAGFNTKPTLETGNIILRPLQENDFEALYAAAADPKIWEQHPNKDRWQEEVFRSFFKGALESNGAFTITDKSIGKVIGSTRFYDYNSVNDSIFIGYTFYTTNYWGKGINRAVKEMMLDYAFKSVSTVYFHIGATNLRSQIAIERVGATKVGEETVAYFGEAPKTNFLYAISRDHNYRKV